MFIIALAVNTARAKDISYAIKLPEIITYDNNNYYKFEYDAHNRIVVVFQFYGESYEKLTTLTYVSQITGFNTTPMLFFPSIFMMSGF